MEHRMIRDDSPIKKYSCNKPLNANFSEQYAVIYTIFDYFSHFLNDTNWLYSISIGIASN